MLNFDLEEFQSVLDITDSKDKILLERAYLLNSKCAQIEGNNLRNYISNETALLLHADFKADLNTIISSLVYHSVKMLKISSSEIKELFNEDIAKKVGYLIKFNSNLFVPNINDRVLMTKSIVEDVKITIIKLIERVSVFHNTCSIPKELILDTLEFYVPITKLLGIYKINNNLEDLCFKYDENYDDIKEIKDNIKNEYSKIKDIVISKFKTQNLIIDKDFRLEFNKRSNYEIFSKAIGYQNKVKQLSDRDIELSGFCSVKCVVDDKKLCYLLVYLIHQFGHLMGTFNDYLSSNYENEYKSIHTNVFIDKCLVDFRICTKEMDKVNLYGITSDWKNDSDLQNRLIQNYEFYNDLVELEKSSYGNELVAEFYKQIINEQTFSTESIEERRTRSLKLMKKGKNK